MVTAARTRNPHRPLRRARHDDGGENPFIWREALLGIDWLSLRPPPVGYRRDDGVINGRNCLEPEPSLNHEVGGTHIGLVFNARAYRVVAELLAQVGDESRRRAA